MLRTIREPGAPRVVRLRHLLSIEIRRGHCNEELAGKLLAAFLSCKVDFVVGSDGELRWWPIPASEYRRMKENGEIKPHE